MKSAVQPPLSPTPESGTPSNRSVEEEQDHALSPLRPSLLDTPEREILEQLQAPTSPTAALAADLPALQNRLQDIAANLEFTVDSFAHGIHVLSTAQDTAERLVDKTLSDAAEALEERQKSRRGESGAVDAFSALKALSKVMNGKRK